MKDEKDGYFAHHTKTKKLRKYYTPFDSRAEVYGAFERLLQKFSHSIIVVSYSSNSLPNREELTEMLKAVKGHVDVKDINHKYSFGTHAHKVGNENNAVREYLFWRRYLRNISAVGRK